MGRPVIHLDRDPLDDWAEVELWRWQYGHLPYVNDTRPLDASAGLSNMADALEAAVKANDMSKAPNPFNLISVMRFCAKRMK